MSRDRRTVDIAKYLGNSVSDYADVSAPCALDGDLDLVDAFVSFWIGLRLWRLGHFHGPDGGGAHIHGGAVVAGDVPGFWSAEPVALGFVGGVIDAPGGFVGFVFEPFAEHETR